MVSEPYTWWYTQQPLDFETLNTASNNILPVDPQCNYANPTQNDAAFW
jgi:hypothetical protein